MSATYRIYVKSSSSTAAELVGWGGVVYAPGDEVWELAGSVPFEDGQTPIRATLLGIAEVLGTLPKSATVEVFTDVQYIAEGFSVHLAKWVARGWRRKDKKRVAHRDLWERIILERDRHQLSISWRDLGLAGRLAAELAAIGQEGERWFKQRSALAKAESPGEIEQGAQ